MAQVGKLDLYCVCAGVNPKYCLPVTIDVGTDTESLLSDPMYLGVRARRDRSPKYDALIDEFMSAARARYGETCLLQFEDFGNENAFRLLDRYQDSYCTFNDDIQVPFTDHVLGLVLLTRLCWCPRDHTHATAFADVIASRGSCFPHVSGL